MSSIVVRDLSHAGHELGRAVVHDLPPTLTLRELLRERIRADVARYNAEPGDVFTGLVQPADSVRHSAGYRMQRPRPLDADLLGAAAEEAVAAGILWFVVGDEPVADLDQRIDVDAHDQVTTILRRPVVARLA